MAIAASLLLAGCGPRAAVVDASNGLPVAAAVRTLPDGSWLVEANGYETWSGPPAARVALHPLWLARFAGEGAQLRRQEPPPPCGGCPGRSR